MTTRNQVKEVKKTNTQINKVSHASKRTFKAVEEPKTKNLATHVKKNYYKQFDFFFSRTCFRYMNEFFKEKYQEFMVHEDKKHASNKSLSAMTKQEMDHNLKQFINYLLGPDLLSKKELSNDQK